VTRGFNEDEYRALLTEFAPRPIEDDRGVTQVEDQIWRMLSLDDRTGAQEAYLSLLSGLVERWESQHVEIPSLSGIELVKVLLRERSLRQKDLVVIFGTESIVSEVLAGKRELQTKHIARLAAFFHVSPSVFFVFPAERTNVPV
jgi:HTH-type transcriptional regulator / antitoxin HigA